MTRNARHTTMARRSVGRPAAAARHLRCLVVALAGLAPLATLRHATAQDSLPKALDARLRAVLISPFAAARLSLPQPAGPYDSAGSSGVGAPEPLIPCFIEGEADRAALLAAGAEPGLFVAGRWTARVPLHRLTAVARVPGVRHMRAAARVHPALDLSSLDTRALLVRGGLPDTARGATGEGVLIGVVDTGIDWSHPDFKTAGGMTRIAAIWDQGDSIGPPPAGFAYGSEWNEAQINLGFCRERDSTYYGHGTHVAGIAAASGRGTGNGKPAFTFVGVAPRARLAIVNTTFYDTQIAEGVAWVFQKAAQLNLPAVANLSLGTAYGPHDGTGELDLAMNALSGPGRVVVASAGNESGRGSHGEGTAPPTGYALMTFRIFGYTPRPTAPDGLSMAGWYEGGDDIALTIKTPSGTLVGPVAKGGSLAMATPDGWVSIDQTGVEAMNTNGDVEAIIEVSDAAGIPPTVGEYELRLTRVAAPHGGGIDFWIYDATFPYPPAMAQGRTEAKTVLSPAGADSVIAVAAHTTRVSWQSINGYLYNYGQTLNQIGNFSSIGPRRDGVPKPDLSAPGTAIGSTHSSTSRPNPSANILPDGVHKILQGTSMSGPHVAGAVAMLMELNPQLSARQARWALQATARADAFTGTLPNATWGAGKLDLDQLLRRVQQFSARIDPPGTVIAGNQIALTELCVTPNLPGWRFRRGARIHVTDTQGWLKYQNGGPPVSAVAFEDTTAAADPGQSACVPRVGQLFVAAPPGTPSGDSTIVTLEAEPLGLPFMRQTLTTVVRVGAISGAPESAGRPARLGLRLLAGSVAGIEFELAQPAPGRLSVALFDVAGRRVLNLFEGTGEAGYRRLTWQGQGEERLPAGIYFVRADDGRDIISRKVVISR